MLRRTILLGVSLLATSACGASFSQAQHELTACTVTRIDFVRAGTFLVVTRPTGPRRIAYGGDPTQLLTAIERAESHCGRIAILHE
jgi:hypothetical protein